jgi:hypothetical protein
MNPVGGHANDANLLYNADFFTLLSPSDEEVTITRMLDKVLRRSDAVDKESLCILAGQRVRNIDFSPQTLPMKSGTPLGLASPINYTLSCRRRQHARLCMSSWHRSFQAFQAT